MFVVVPLRGLNMNQRVHINELQYRKPESSWGQNYVNGKFSVSVIGGKLQSETALTTGVELFLGISYHRLHYVGGL